MDVPRKQDDDTEDWDAIDAEYDAFLQEAYGGQLPTLAELARDVALMRQELRQIPAAN